MTAPFFGFTPPRLIKACDLESTLQIFSVEVLDDPTAGVAPIVVQRI